MKCAHFVTLILCIRYISSQYVATENQPKSPCESDAKNGLIEHFFNIIFSEFQATPPVCVCVQLCVAQSTYCYPNGCLQKGDIMKVDSPQHTNTQTNTHTRTEQKNYMFVVDQKNDFMNDYFKNNIVDETKIVPAPDKEPMNHKSTDSIKDKYSMILKYKKLPSLRTRYNLREQMKNIKSDILKIDSIDLSKTRWPTNKQKLISAHKGRSKIQKVIPSVSKPSFFMSMLSAKDYAEYPPKYFKRDISKTLGSNDTRGYYIFENAVNTAKNNDTEVPMSLESLIDILINNVKIKPNETEKETESKQRRKNEISTEKSSDVVDKPDLLNDTVNVLSINLTNERMDKNKYADEYVTPRTKMFSEMISNLSKRIEKQNNTSLEIAKRIVSDFDEEKTTLITNTELNSNENVTIEINDIESANENTTTTPADFKGTVVTKKYRQRRVRKSQNSKINIL